MANSAALRRLGAELRRLRDAAGLTQAQAASELGRTSTTIINWERGKTQISKSDLVLLLAAFRTPTETREMLEQLRQEARQHGGRRWATYGLPSWLRSLAGFEDDAAVISSYESSVIPGLVQTEDYARSVISALPQVMATRSLDAAVESRLARQERIFGDNPATFHAIIAETALRLEVGGPDVTAGQLQRIIDASQADNVTIQVLPMSRGAHIASMAGFGVLEFEDPTANPPLAFFDSPLGGYLVHDAGEVATLSTVFADLTSAALSPDDSAAQVAAILSQFTRKGTGHA